MSLSGALQVGRSGLLANQAAIEVAGNNLANVATRGYHRQSIELSPANSQQIQQNVFVGRGVQIQNILRQVDEALESRVRSSAADQSGAQASQDILSQIQALENEFSGNDLSTRLGALFSSFSDLANNPSDNSQRSVVVQEADSLTSFITGLRGELGDLREQVDKDIDASGTAVNDLLTQIDQLNTQIAQADGGSGGAAGLRDQRDQLLGQLSQYVDVSTREQASGSVDVFVGSLPVILNGHNRGVQVQRKTVNGELQINLILSDDNSVLEPTSGKLGALLASRQDDVNGAVQKIDDFTKQLIFQVNRIHSQGQGLSGVTSVTADNRALDANAALNSAAAGLDFTPQHGSFQISVTQKSTGARSDATINVDLDGINPAGDTTLNSLAAAIDGVANITASVTGDGRLKITTDSNDFEITFSNDSSGALAALGINTFFSGSDASDIAVNNVVAQDPGKIATGQGNVSGDNTNALALAGLNTQGLDDLGGLSLPELWNRHVEDFAVRLSQAGSRVDSNTLVQQNLQAQQQSTSGVNTDEEAIDLLSFQRAYQGSARFLSVVDQMFQTLLGMLG